MKKKIVTINCTGYDGSTGQIIKDIDKYTGDEFDYVHYYQLPEENVPNGYLLTKWNVTRFYYYLSRVTGKRYGLGNGPTKKLISKISAQKPDLVHIHCPNFYTINLYMILEYLKREAIPTIVTNHAEFFYTGGCAYAYDCEGYESGCKTCSRQFDEVHKFLRSRTSWEWEKMKQTFSDAPQITMVAVSDWARDRISAAPITKGLPVVTIENGVDTTVFNYAADKSMLSARPKVLNVTSHFSAREGDIKGGRYLLELAKKRPAYDFVVAGEYEQVMDIPGNLTLLGSISDKGELAALYQSANATVLTSQKETFGMAYAESVCCGTPVAAFEAGGTESIAIPGTASFVEFADTERLAQALDDVLAADYDRQKISAEAINHFSAERMAHDYAALYREKIG